MKTTMEPKELFRVLDQYKTKKFQSVLHDLEKVHNTLKEDSLSKDEFDNAMHMLETLKTYKPRQFKDKIVTLYETLYVELEKYKISVLEIDQKENKVASVTIEEDTPVSLALKKALALKEERKEEEVTQIDRVYSRIDDIREAYNNLEKEYKLAYDTVGYCDKETSDLLHLFELVKLTEEEKDKYLKQLVLSRKTRREAKDYVDLVTPALQCLKDLNLLTRLNSAKSTANSRNKDRDKRVYSVRVLDELKPIFENNSIK